MDVHLQEGGATEAAGKIAAVYGDAWVWMAFSPMHRLVPAWVVGKRTLHHARRLVFRLKSATDGHIPFFTSDDLPHYAEALVEACDPGDGRWTNGSCVDHG